MAKTTDVKKRTKTQIVTEIADETGLTKKQVQAVFDALGTQIKKDLGRRGPGEYTIPGLIKLRMVKKPATKARMGHNPATGEPMQIKAKPARNQVKATPLKALKDMVLA